MGTWAAGSFENDDALDWLQLLYQTKDFSRVREALSGDFETAPEHLARRAIAAADLVACSLGHPPRETKRFGLVEWTRGHASAFDPDLPKLAREAVVMIKVRSKLRDCWNGGDDSVNADWLDSISDLERRLQMREDV